MRPAIRSAKISSSETRSARFPRKNAPNMPYFDVNNQALPKNVKIATYIAVFVPPNDTMKSIHAILKHGSTTHSTKKRTNLWTAFNKISLLICSL